MLDKTKASWNRMKTEQRYLYDAVDAEINIGIESSVIVEGRHKESERLHSSPDIVAKYIRITLLDQWYDYRRWSSIHSSLQEIKTLMDGDLTRIREIKHHHNNIILALRDCLLRTAHTVYLTLGQLPEFKPYAQFLWLHVSHIIVSLFISRILTCLNSGMIAGYGGCPHLSRSLLHSLRASQVS